MIFDKIFLILHVMSKLMTNISAVIERCSDDIAGLNTINLDAQIRAYDLLDAMLQDEVGMYRSEPGFSPAKERFMKAFRHGVPAYDEERLQEELAEILQPLDENLKEEKFKAAAAASLHEFAKETFEVWQNSGIFARRRALKELRARAGFRLESHRIGNYVAKTFDLMNEADTRFAKAQQARFAADVSYKIKPGLYEKIAVALEKDLS